jgi:plasmid stabilization system protein ParE
MVEITWTDLAIDDLQSIYNYIAKDSVYYAEKHVNRL